MMPYFFVSFSYAKTYPLRESVETRTFVNYISMSSGRNTLEFSDTICYYLSWKVLRFGSCGLGNCGNVFGCVEDV